MQAKRHVTKLIKFSSKYPCGKPWKAVLQQQKFRKVSRQTELGNEEIDFVVLAEYFDKQTDCSRYRNYTYNFENIFTAWP